MQVENYPFNSENNEIAGLVDVSTETLSSEHVHELPSLARTQSISPLNPTVGQGNVKLPIFLHFQMHQTIIVFVPFYRFEPHN